MLLSIVLVLVHGQKIVDIKIDPLTRHARNLEFQKKELISSYLFLEGVCLFFQVLLSPALLGSQEKKSE